MNDNTKLHILECLDNELNELNHIKSYLSDEEIEYANKNIGNLINDEDILSQQRIISENIASIIDKSKKYDILDYINNCDIKVLTELKNSILENKNILQDALLIKKVHSSIFIDSCYLYNIPQRMRYIKTPIIKVNKIQIANDLYLFKIETNEALFGEYEFIYSKIKKQKYPNIILLSKEIEKELENEAKNTLWNLLILRNEGFSHDYMVGTMNSLKNVLYKTYKFNLDNKIWNFNSYNFFDNRKMEKGSVRTLKEQYEKKSN